MDVQKVPKFKEVCVFCNNAIEIRDFGIVLFRTTSIFAALVANGDTDSCDLDLEPAGKMEPICIACALTREIPGLDKNKLAVALGGRHGRN